VTELETVLAPDTNIRLAGKQEQPGRLRNPPPFEQLGLGPRLVRAGPLKVRVTTSSRSDFRSTFVGFFMGAGSLSRLAPIDFFLSPQFLDNVVQRIEACLPELAVLLNPCRLFFQSVSAELSVRTRPTFSVARAGRARPVVAGRLLFQRL
jgi:hypothetical protein